jgi:hypothetical protein
MTPVHHEDSLLALTALKFFPVSIRESLISDSSFRNRYGLSNDGQITFGDNEVSFQTSGFYNSIRKILEKRGAQKILLDTSEREWLLEIVLVNKECRISLSHGECKFFLPDLSAFSPDRTERLNAFERIAEEVNLPEKTVNKWRKILSYAALQDDEFGELHNEIKETPIRVATLVKTEITRGESSFSTIIPRSSHYFNSLVGEYQQSLNIVEYASSEAKKHISQLMSWRAYDGFLLALLLSSHSSLPSTIDINRLNEDTLVQAYDWLKVKGDRISQLGAIEIGLSILDKHPKIEPYIANLIQQIRDDNCNDGHSRFMLLSALIVLVDGEFARTRIFCEKPPFWRRLSSIAQASLIEREIISLPVDVTDFSKWALQTRAQLYYLQGMSDLRQEPRWQPDSVSATQLKAEFIGRIINVANQNTSKIEASTLSDLLFGESPESLQLLIEFPFPFLPGPLEGGIELKTTPSEDFLRVIEEQLSENRLQPTSFAALVNSALLFRFDSNQAELAVKAIRGVKYQLKQIGNKDDLIYVLRGLATVASVTRSVELADELKILVRRYRHEPIHKLSAEDTLWLGLIAAAAHSDLTNWCHFVGEWVTELAFQTLQHNEIEKLHSHIQQLCHIVPELWVTCGRADAALNSVGMHTNSPI